MSFQHNKNCSEDYFYIKDKDIKNKKLLGVAISVKDAICVKNVESTAGSKILKGYKPLFDATVVKRAKEAGAIIIGKTAQDEFGFGSFSVNVGLGFNVPKNPFDKSRACGGSSGGAGGITKKASFPHIALGESTGGSIASPASFCGVFGLCPTYGRVSRYGLMDYANSLDKIGPLGKSAYDAALLLETVSGFDENESVGIACDFAQISTGVGVNTCFRPTGRGGCVTTAHTGTRSFSKTKTESEVEPKKMTFI